MKLTEKIRLWWKWDCRINAVKSFFCGIFTFIYVSFLLLLAVVYCKLTGRRHF